MVTLRNELSPEQFNKLTQQFIEDRQSAGIAGNTLRRYGVYFRKLSEWLAGNGFSRETLEAYVRHVKNTVSFASSRTICAQVFVFTGWLYREGYTSCDFAWGVRELASNDVYTSLTKTVLLCSREEFPTYRNACNAVLQRAMESYQKDQKELNLQSYALVSLLRETGIRFEELVKVTGDDLVADCTLSIQGSASCNARVVSVMQSGYLLRKLKNIYGHEVLFRNREGGPVSYSVIRYRISSLARDAGVTCTLKMFRAVKTVELIQSGAGIIKLMHTLGLSYTTAVLLLKQYKEWSV